MLGRVKKTDACLKHAPRVYGGKIRTVTSLDDEGASLNSSAKSNSEELSSCSCCMCIHL